MLYNYNELFYNDHIGERTLRTLTKKHIWLTVGRVGIFLLVTVLLLLLAAAAVLVLIARGPSAVASRNLAETLVAQNSPLANILYTKDELGEIAYYAAPRDVSAGVEISAGGYAEPEVIKVTSSAWGGVIIDNIDPARLCISSGEAEKAKGMGEHSFSIGILGDEADISLIGERFNYKGDGAGYNAFGTDADGILHCGRYTAAAVFNSGWNFALPCERVLIGGIPMRELGGGYSSRIAIGQKEDGSMIIALLSPRGIYPRGATYDELCALMYECGAVTAVAVTPAGNSYVNGETVNLGGTSPARFNITLADIGTAE